MFASVRSSLEEYFETKSDDGEQEEAVVVASDGSLQIRFQIAKCKWKNFLMKT